MYQIIMKTEVNGVRQMDSIYTKTYKRKGFAEKQASGMVSDFVNHRNERVKKWTEVLPVFRHVSADKAKEEYCKCNYVWVDGEYGYEMLTPSWHYGSHAPADELFYRSVHSAAEVYDYKGNYYIPVDK